MNITRYYILLCTFILIFLGMASAQWVKTSAPTNNVFSIVTDGTRIFAASNNEGVYVSSDDGATWQKCKLDPVPAIDTLIAKELRGMEIFGDTLFVFGQGFSKMNVADTLFSSFQSLNLGPYTASTLFASGGNLVLGGGAFEGMYHSTNYGTTWSAYNYPPNPQLHVNVFSIFGSTLLAGTLDTIYRSTDAGTVWTPVSSFPPLGSNLSCFHNHSSGIYAGGHYSLNPILLRSTDDGVSWANVTTAGLLTTNINSIASDGPNLYCVVLGRGVFVSTNNGANWTTANTGLTSPNQSNKIIVKGTNAFLSTLISSSTGSGVWKRPVIQLTGIEPISNKEVPSSFTLDQNFPNPFNPSTVIKYQLPVDANVKISLFNSIGEELITLVNENKHAGIYEFQFNASGFASGIYYYRIVSGNFTDTKKLVILK